MDTSTDAFSKNCYAVWIPTEPCNVILDPFKGGNLVLQTVVSRRCFLKLFRSEEANNTKAVARSIANDIDDT